MIEECLKEQESILAKLENPAIATIRNDKDLQDAEESRNFFYQDLRETSSFLEHCKVCSKCGMHRELIEKQVTVINRLIVAVERLIADYKNPQGIVHSEKVRKVRNTDWTNVDLSELGSNLAVN